MMDILKIIQNPEAIAAKLPPAPVVIGALSRLIREAIIGEMERGPIPPGFVIAIRERYPDMTEEEAADLYRWLWRQV